MHMHTASWSLRSPWRLGRNPPSKAHAETTDPSQPLPWFSLMAAGINLSCSTGKCCRSWHRIRGPFGGGQLPCWFSCCPSFKQRRLRMSLLPAASKLAMMTSSSRLTSVPALAGPQWSGMSAIAQEVFAAALMIPSAASPSATAPRSPGFCPLEVSGLATRDARPRFSFLS